MTGSHCTNRRVTVTKVNKKNNHEKTILSYHLTEQLTGPRTIQSCVLLEMLKVPQMIKKFPSFNSSECLLQST